MAQLSLSLIHISVLPQHPSSFCKHPFFLDNTLHSSRDCALSVRPSLANLKFCLDELPREKTPHIIIHCYSVKNLSWKEVLNEVDLLPLIFSFTGLILWPVQGGNCMTSDSLSTRNFDIEELKKKTELAVDVEPIQGEGIQAPKF